MDKDHWSEIYGYNLYYIAMHLKERSLNQNVTQDSLHSIIRSCMPSRLGPPRKLGFHQDLATPNVSQFLDQVFHSHHTTKKYKLE